MRRSVLSAVLAAALLLVACSDQPTEPRPGAISPPSFVTTSCPAVVDASEIMSQIDQLYPSGSLRNSAQSQFKSIPTKITKTTGAAARDKMFALIDFTLKNYYAGNLNGGTSTEAFDKVLRLIEALHCFVGLTPPEFPSTTSGSDVVVGVVFQNSPTTTFSVPSGHAAVTIPTGAAPAATTIVIQRLPNSPPPLRTSLDQYRPFYHFSGTTATGPVTFNLDVTAGICLEENRPGLVFDNLRLAHNVGPNFGDVEILPRPAGVVPGLTCPELGGGGELGLLSAAGSRESGPFAWAERLLLPAELHAASNAVIELGVGGTTKKFSEFAIVDISSNPGAFAPVGPTSTTEAGGSTITRTVLVTSDNGTPIVNVPVTFTTEEGNGDVLTPQPVLTNSDGEASVSWVLPEGAGVFTLNASVPDEDNEPFDTSDPSTENVASTPDVAFEPTSLTFTATVLAPEVTITLGGPVTFLSQCEGEPSVCSEAFTQDGYELQSFWLSGEVSDPPGAVLQTIPGHFHMLSDPTAGTFNGYEGHHFQHDFDRQGIRIRRTGGGTFTLQSIEYRPRESFPGTPFEIGTSPMTSIVVDQTETYVTLASGYTTFPAPAGDFTFQTVTFSGFEDVTEVYITMRGAADWRNIVLTQGP